MSRRAGIGLVAAGLVAACGTAARAADAGGQRPAARDTITIEEAVREALARNLTLAAERDNVAVANAAVLTAGLRPNPVITANLMRPNSDLVAAGVATDEEVF